MSSWRGTGYSRETTTTTTTTTEGRGGPRSRTLPRGRSAGTRPGFGRPSRRVLASGAGRDGPERTRGIADWRRPERRSASSTAERVRWGHPIAAPRSAPSSLAGKVAAAALIVRRRQSRRRRLIVPRLILVLRRWAPEGRYEQRRVRDPRRDAYERAGARIEITTEEEEDGDGNGHSRRLGNTPERAPSSPDDRGVRGHRRQVARPADESRAAKFMATLGAARRRNGGGPRRHSQAPGASRGGRNRAAVPEHAQHPRGAARPARFAKFRVIARTTPRR